MIYLFISDMIFRSRVENELLNLELNGKFVKSIDEVEELTNESIAIFDLAESDALEVLKVFREKYSQVKTLGYLPHVNEGLKEQAVQAGCGRVMARFEFVKNLPEILQGK